MRYFIDAVGKLSNVRRTPQGGMLVEASLARTGILEYLTKTGLVRRYNPLSALEGALDSVATAPVTRLHPTKFVDVHNFRELSAGHVVGTPVIQDGHIVATLAIQDATLINDIEMGAMREISMGYMAEHDGKPGVTEDGDSFDESRTSITINHLAVVPAGRAGRTVRLMLDSDTIPTEESPTMSITINGVTVDAPSAQSAFDSYDAGLQAQLAKLTADKATLEAKVVELDAALVVAQSAETIDAAVNARIAKEAADKAAAEKLERVKAAYPTIALEGRSKDFIDALDLRIEADAKKDPSGLGQLDGTANVGVTPPAVKQTDAKKKPVDARAAMRAYNASLCKAPIGEKGLPAAV